MRNASFPALIDTCGTDTDSLSHSIPEYFLQADNEEAMKDWVKDIEETSVTAVPVLGHGGTGGDSGAAPVAARKVSYIEDRELPSLWEEFSSSPLAFTMQTKCCNARPYIVCSGVI